MQIKNNQEFITEFFNHKKIYISERTIVIYKINLKKFLEFTNKPVKDLTLFDVSSFSNHLQENNYQNATISNYLSTIKTFLKFGTDIGHLKFPYGLIRLPKVDEHAPAFVSREEYEMINELLDEDNFESLTKRLVFRLL
jgi:integrase/recombinase XerD